MSKKTNVQIVKDLEPSSMDARSVEYVTTSGHKIIVVGLPPLLVPMISSSVKYPVRPTYTVETVDGRTETYDHDETTLQTDEDRHSWENYLKKQEEAERESSELMLDAVIMNSVNAKVNTEEMEKWARKQRIIGIKISEDIDELEFQFKKVCVLANKEDVQFVMDMAMRLTGVDQEAVDSIKSSFPDTP